MVVLLLILTFAVYMGQGYLSGFIEAKDIKNQWLVLWLFSCVPLWPMVTKFTTNVVRDAIIFDLLLIVGFHIGLIIFGSYNGLTPQQWAGACLAIFGLILFTI